jgi:alpha-1,2-mannosyltransferase
MIASADRSKLFIISAGLVLALLFLYPTAVFLLKAFNGFAWDFSINWTAAIALRQKIPLYHQAELQQIAMQQIDSSMQTLFTGPFKSFISLPTTALLMLPFTFFPFDTAIQLYRACTLLAFLGGITLTSFATTREYRTPTLLIGIACLVLWDSGQFSLTLGQIDGWVVLMLGMILFSVKHQYWRLAGMGIGVATLLKISPVLLLFYCILKRQWTIVFAAVATLSLGLLLCWLPHSGADLQEFVSDVIPILSNGTRHVQNQALGAFLARLTSDNPDLLRFSLTAGYWKFISVGFIAILLLALWRQCSTHLLNATELACVIVLTLLAGPISWDHYCTWAILPAMLLIGSMRTWQSFSITSLLLVPFYFAIPYKNAAIVADQWWWRVFSSGYTLALIALFFAMLLHIQRLQRLR